MSLLIFQGNYQTYPNPGLPLALSNGYDSETGESVITWSLGTQAAATGIANPSTATTGITSVLLLPDLEYTYELDQPGVGGVITELTFKPTGSISGQTVTEAVMVGSFAYWDTAATDLVSLYNYTIGNGSTADETAYKAIDAAFQSLLGGGSPSAAETAINNAIKSSGDATFAEYAETIPGVAAEWDTPIYELNGEYYTGADPAGFGAHLIDVNGTEATWGVSGSSGGVQVSGFTAYSTYNAQTNVGTYDIVDADTAGSLEIATQSGSSGGSTPARNDFFGNGTSDILFVNSSNGSVGFYHMANGADAGWSAISSASTAYTLVGTGDFMGNGTDDILFRNNATGDTGFYSIVNGVNTGWHDVGASSTAYSVVGIGDFTGSGTDDILFRNNATGDTGFYDIVNGVNTGWHDVGASSTAYRVVGVGDFMGNGTDDILFRNNATGDTGFYDIVSGLNTGWHDIGASSTAYTVVGVGDFMGNGTDDILFRDNATGDTGFYDIVHGVNTGWHDIGASSTAYSVVSVGDFTGNGTDDILFRNNTTGDTGFYSILSGASTGWHDLGPSSTAYQVISG
jgi:hypothetical protein